MEYLKSIVYYFFAISPGQNFRYYYVLLGLALIFIIGSLIFGFIYNKRKKHDFAFKKIFKKVSKFSLALGITFFILMLLRYESIPYFSMRLWLYLAFLCAAFFLYYYIRKAIKVYPKERHNVETNKKETKVVYYSTKKKRK